MRRWYPLCLMCVFACKESPPPASSTTTAGDSTRRNTTTFSRDSGGSMRLNLGYGITINERTSLQREWIAAHDSLAPVDLLGTPGIVTAYRSSGSYSYGGYEARSSYGLQVRDSVVAVEVRFVAFDVWGNPLRTFTATHVEDLPPGQSHQFDDKWSLSSYDTDVSELYGSIAYVARVRRKNGRTWEANDAPLLEEARRFSVRFTAEDLLPPNERRGRDSTTDVSTRR